MAPARPGNSAETLKAVQSKLKTFVDSGQLGIFTNAFFLGGHKAYVLSPEVDLLATAHYLEALHMRLMGPLLETDSCIVLDAVLGDDAPGTIYRLTGNDLRKSLAFKDSMPPLISEG